MAYTSILKLAQPVTGTEDGTWGETINNAITEPIEEAIAGTVTVAHTDAASVTLTSGDGSASNQSRYMFINVTGALTAARQVICPAASKLYFVANNTTGGYAITFKTSGGTGISVANGKKASLYCDGTNVVYAFDQVTLQPTVSVTGNMDNGTTDYAVTVTPAIQSNVTTSANIFYSAPTTEADTFTLTNLRHYYVSQGTFGAGSTVANQYGFIVGSGLTAATRNFGFQANTSATASVAISSISGTGSTATVETAASHGLTTGDSVFISGTSTAGFNGGPFTVTVVDTDTFTFSSTETTASSGGYSTKTNNWNFYANGTAPNWFGGPTIVSANSRMDALRITQAGGGNSLVVEDETNPDTSPFVITSAGNVGIGTTSPTSYGIGLAAVAAMTPASYTGFGFWDSTTGGAANVGGIITFGGNDGSSATRTFSAIQGGKENGTSGNYASYLRFATRANGGSVTERMRIDSAGNVGIGPAVSPASFARITVAPQTSVGSAAGTLMTDTSNLFTLCTRYSSVAPVLAYGVRTQNAAGYEDAVFKSTYASALARAAVDVGQSGAIRFFTSGTQTVAVDSDITVTERMRITSTGNLGLNATSLSNTAFRNSQDITGSTTAYGMYADGVIQSDVTTNGIYFRSVASTEAAAFTLSALRHFSAAQSTLGAGSTVTSQFGFIAESSLVDATNNYGFYSNIPASTNDWNFYAAGTANNYFAGNVGIGTTTPSYPLSVYSSTGTAMTVTTTGVSNSQLVCSDASNGVAYVALYRDSASPANADNLFALRFNGNNSAAAAIEYARIGTAALNVTAGSEAGRILFYVYSAAAGGITSKMDIRDNITYAAGFNDTTTASAANLFINSSTSQVSRSTSSIRYKTDVENIQDQYVQNIHNLRPIWYRSLSGADNAGWSWYGLIAEEVAQVEPRLVHWRYADDQYDEVEVLDIEGEAPRKEKVLKDGAVQTPDGVQYERLTVLLLAEVQKLRAELDALKAV